MAAVVNLPAEIIGALDWQVGAACRGMSVDVFYNGDNERGARKRQRDATAKAICANCPVISECLNWAMSVGEPNGVWGGLTTDERSELSRTERSELSRTERSGARSRTERSELSRTERRQLSAGERLSIAN